MRIQTFIVKPEGEKAEKPALWASTLKTRDKAEILTSSRSSVNTPEVKKQS